MFESQRVQPTGVGHPADGALGAHEGLRAIDGLVGRVTSLGEAVSACGSWTGEQRREAMRRLDRIAGALATVRATLLLAEQQAPGAVHPGDRDFVAARARDARTGLGEARREVRQAQTLAALPAVADAVGDGRVPLPHLDALARVAEAAGQRATGELTRPETQERLVRMAEQQSVREFGAAAARLLASFDPEDLERTAAAQRRARFFVMSRQPDGTYLKGRLDHMSAEALRTAIAAVGHAPDAERTKEQADADALVALAERAVSGTAGVRARRLSPSGDLVPDPEQDAADARVSGSCGRPTVSVLVPAETFAELQAMQRRRMDAVADGAMTQGMPARVAGVSGTDRAGTAPTGTGPAAQEVGDRTWEWRPVEPAVLQDGTALAMSELARVLCDSEVGRIVLSADGVPLDLGRTERLFSGHQRRAVIVRDRQCAWNGCEVPAAYSEVHHIRWWDRDRGPTSVENGVLLCSHHHHVVHQMDLSIVRLRRPPTGGPMLGDPLRYVFERRDGRTINAPPGCVDVLPEGQPRDRPVGRPVGRPPEEAHGPGAPSDPPGLDIEGFLRAG